MRKCGSCTLCCDYLGVTEIHKPEFCECWNLDRKGCAVYDNRPPSCRQFDCAWRRGDVPKRLMQSTTKAVITSDSNMVQVYTRGRLNKSVLEYVTKYAREGVTVIVAIEDRRFQVTPLGTMREVFRPGEDPDKLSVTLYP